MVGDSLKRACIAITKQRGLRVDYLKKLGHFISETCSEYAEFKKDESNKILFGHKTEMDDIRHAQMHMRVVPTDEQEFELVRNPAVCQLLATFGIRKDPTGKG